jgi:hypothetical protein
MMSAAITYGGGLTWRMLLPHIDALVLLPHIDALASYAPPDAGTGTTTFLLNQAGVFPATVARSGPDGCPGRVQETLAARGGRAVADQAAGGLGRAIPLVPG